MMKKSALLIAVFVMAFSLSVGNLMAQGNNSPAGAGKQKKTTPFLITGKLPHLTKMLMQQWDNPELNLQDAQKSKLLVVREETISGVRRIGGEIAPLEKQVAEGIFAGKTPDELGPIVQEIAGMKAEATMLHLRCISNTSEILDKQQLDFLINTAKK